MEKDGEFHESRFQIQIKKAKINKKAEDDPRAALPIHAEKGISFLIRTFAIQKHPRALTPEPQNADCDTPSVEELHSLMRAMLSRRLK